MKEVTKMFLTFAALFWLIILHYLAFYFIDININVAFGLGITLAHVDMLLIAMFFVGYAKKHEEVEESK